MIVVDSSAIIAVVNREPERERILERLEAASLRLISEINYVEIGMMLTGRSLTLSARDVDDWLRRLDIEVHGAGGLGHAAFAAYLRFGKGRHPARLNLADCFAYALAKQLDVPLLYKGADFSQTDIRSALQPT